uniref:protein disulfide-isomerase n=1 Tax=Canis lupus familiaris TaxID=9615 RepID=A0A8C0MWE6_CANLF
MDGQLLLALLLLLLGASGLRGQGPGGPEEEPLEEEKVPEEDGILVLNQRNLGLALRAHRTLLVQFYAPWCGHCKALAPEYSKAAALLAAESAEARLAKVDGPAEAELTKEFAVTEYPTLKFFRDGNRTHPEEYTGPKEADGMAEWLRRRVGPSAMRLADAEGAQALIDSRDVVVIGFFRDRQDEDVATFLALAQDALDMTFGLTDQPKLFEKFGVAKDTIVLFKKFDEGRADFPVDEELGLDQGDLSRFLLTHSMHLVTEFNSQTSPKIFAARILNHLLLFVNQTLAEHRELLEGFGEAAPPFRGQVLFVVVDVGASNAHVLQYFGLKAEEAPALRIINMETTKKYAPVGGGPLTAAAVATFCHAVLSGQVKPYLLSQDVPPDWDRRPVKTLVGKNFEQVAFDETKNVFVKFCECRGRGRRGEGEGGGREGVGGKEGGGRGGRGEGGRGRTALRPRQRPAALDAPWCTHCKAMAAAWEALAEKYKDHEDIVIAELDATANELEAFPVHGFPTLKYFPAGPGRKVRRVRPPRAGAGPPVTQGVGAGPGRGRGLLRGARSPRAGRGGPRWWGVLRRTWRPSGDRVQKH